MSNLAMAYAMKRRGKKMADGGFVREEEDSGYEKMPEESHMDCDNDDMDMIDHIMSKNSKKYSEGGMVANQDHGEDDNELADFSPNEFDDMAMDDDLHSSYDGANSGDEIGNEAEDHDRDDMISQIMRSKKMKDKMPIAGYGSSYGRNK